ncbi:hypothetical protein LSAT2_003849 [Lamellibrachia satsuma]|nr:hypothetical protein LSAT2_003849 [Lamellibrachia satsuma]
MAPVRLIAFCLLLYFSSVLNTLATPVLSPRPIDARLRVGTDRSVDGNPRVGQPEENNPVLSDETGQQSKLTASYRRLDRLVRRPRARPESPERPDRSFREAPRVERPELARVMLKVAAWLDRLLGKVQQPPAQQATGDGRHGATIEGYTSDSSSQPLPASEGDRYSDDVFAQPKLRTQPKRKCVTKRNMKTTISEGSFGQFGSRRRAFVNSDSFSRTGSASPRWNPGQARYGDSQRLPGSRHGDSDAAGSEHSGYHSRILDSISPDQVVIADNPQETIFKSHDREQNLRPTVIWHSSAVSHDQLGLRSLPVAETALHAGREGRPSVTEEADNDDC